mmetsp:Transcript_20362/g.20766  ORF Transcript_20362/g.20766 Transcript_20362/m.20766 type:complete len:82 (-) Transcript_20362:297-542(-)
MNNNNKTKKEKETRTEILAEIYLKLSLLLLDIFLFPFDSYHLHRLLNFIQYIETGLRHPSPLYCSRCRSKKIFIGGASSSS